MKKSFATGEIQGKKDYKRYLRYIYIYGFFISLQRNMQYERELIPIFFVLNFLNFDFYISIPFRYEHNEKNFFKITEKNNKNY